MHTNEPWRFEKLCEDNYEISHEHGMGQIEVAATAIRQENALRIVACVNACAGFSIEEIEGANFHKDSFAAQEEIDLLEKQRDSALAKLSSMTIDRDSWEDQADARVKDWLEMKEQRDEILSELELIYSWSHNWNSEFMNDPEWKNVDETRIKALVARVKGNGLGAILNSEAIEHCRDGETT